MYDVLPTNLQQPFQGVLFDFDGTIVDSEAQHFAAFRQAMDEHGYDFKSVADKLHMQGNFRKIFEGVAKELQLPADMYDQIYQRKMELTLGLRLGDIDLIEGIVSYLEYLREQNIPAGIVTNADPEYIQHVLRLHDLDQYFQAIVTPDDHNEPKPAPDGYLLGASRLQIDPSAALVFENTDTGISAGKAAGMPVIAIRDTDVQGLSTYEEADHVMDSFADPVLDDLHYERN